MGRHYTIIQPPLALSRDFIDYPYHCDLGVVQAAAVVRSQGGQVSVVNAFSMPSSTLAPLASDTEAVLMGAPIQDTVDAACVGPTDVFVIHFTPFHRPPGRDPVLGEILAALHTERPTTPILLADLYQSGQHYVETSSALVLRAYPEVDALLKYEAEEALVSLCEQLIVARQSSAPRPKQFAERGSDSIELEDVPMPAWDLIDLDARDTFMSRVITHLGRGGWAFPADGRTLPMVSSRGCPYRCAHCSSNPGRPEIASPKTQRRYSADYLRDAVDQMVATHGATRIDFLDEMVNVKPGHFDALLGALSEHDVAFDFPNGMRADWVQPEQLDAMAGRVATLSVSAESGVQRVIDEVVGKNLDLQAIERTVKGATERGIATLVHFIIGMPGETKAEINQTLAYALHLWESYGAWPSVQFATPLPGTQLALNAAKASKLQDAEIAPVQDYSPLFQHLAVTRDEDFTPEELHRFKWTFDQRLAAGRGPTKVIMNVTYRCNNHCTFCATGNRSQLDGDFHNQREILQGFASKGLWQVDFDGGEPTLYDKLIPLVKSARHMGYSRINVTTNGRRCVYPAYANKLVNSGLTTLLFSVHGHDAKTHAQNVGVAEAFEQTIEGIKNCVRFAPPGVELGMNITITKSNFDKLPIITQLAWDLGLPWLNVQFLTPFGRATVHVNPDTSAAAQIAMDVMDEWGDRMKFQIINLPFCFMPGYEQFMMGDLLKIQRHMVFINNIDVNLFEYLKEQRGYQDECHSCPHKSFCGGFYELKNSKQLPWVVTKEDTQAPLQLDGAGA